MSTVAIPLAIPLGVLSVNHVWNTPKGLTAILFFNSVLTTLSRRFDKFTAELHPIPVKEEVWHTIGVNLIGPLPETTRGNKYIITVSCLFSKWPEVKITDQGREFVNKVLHVVNPKLNIMKLSHYGCYLMLSYVHR